MFEQSVHSLLTSAPLLSARIMGNDPAGDDAVVYCAMLVKKSTSIAAVSASSLFNLEPSKAPLNLYFVGVSISSIIFRY